MNVYPLQQGNCDEENETLCAVFRERADAEKEAITIVEELHRFSPNLDDYTTESYTNPHGEFYAVLVDKSTGYEVDWLKVTTEQLR